MVVSLRALQQREGFEAGDFVQVRVAFAPDFFEAGFGSRRNLKRFIAINIVFAPTTR